MVKFPLIDFPEKSLHSDVVEVVRGNRYVEITKGSWMELAWEY